MKKLLLLLCTMFLCLGETWAADVTVKLSDQTDSDGITNQSTSEATATHKYGTYSGSDVANTPYYTTFTTNAASGLAGLTVSTTAKILKPTYISSQFSCYQHCMAVFYDKTDNTTEYTFTITAPNGYYIKYYSLQAVSTSDGGGFTVSANGTSYEVKGQGYQLNRKFDVYTPTATFTVKRNTTNNGSTLCIPNFSVVLAPYDASTWTSGLAVEDIDNYYSNVWYLKLTTPSVNDVFFNSFTLGHCSNGSYDDDIETYLAFTYNTFTSQYNHEANEFIAISNNSVSGHSSSTAVGKEYTFSDKIRLNSNTTIYACFVSKNLDGTYTLRKRGVGVKSGGSMDFCYGNTYSKNNSTVSYTPSYSCTYQTNNYFEQKSDNYHIWSKNNVGDKTSGGKIHISTMKLTAPGTSGQYIHFDSFSILMRDESVIANTYLLFSKEYLLGDKATKADDNNTSNTYSASKFTAISNNCIPTANYGKVFDFKFDSDQYLEGGQNYYVYMGKKQEDGSFTLCRYGLFINHLYGGENSGLVTYGGLQTAENASESHNDWCCIYYSSKCQMTDQKVTVNIQEGGNTIRTKTIYTNADVDVKNQFNIASVYTVTPSTISHVAGSSTQNVTIQAAFTPSETPATETQKISFIKVSNKFCVPTSESTNPTLVSENLANISNLYAQWTIGGNYYDGYTLYNRGKGKYVNTAVGTGQNGTFVDAGSESKYYAVSNGTDYSFQLISGTLTPYYIYSSDGTLSTWNELDSGCKMKFKTHNDMLVDVSVLWGTQINQKSYGYTFGKFSYEGYTLGMVNELNSTLKTVHESGTLSDKELAYSTVYDLYSNKLNLSPTFLRIKSVKQGGYYLSNGSITKQSKERITFVNSADNSTIYYFNGTHLLNYQNAHFVNEENSFTKNGSLGNTGTTFKFSVTDYNATISSSTVYYITFKNNTRSLYAQKSGDEYYTDAADATQTSSGYDFYLEEVTSLPVTISSVGYASFNSPVAVEIPDGVTAFVLSSASESSLSLTSIDDGIIPANTAVVLKGAAGTYNFNITSEAGTATSLFSGTIAAISVTSGQNYTLQNDTEQGVAFYILNNTYIPGFKAYYPKPVSGAKALTFVFDTETGIDNRILEQTGEKIYDLQGRLVEKAGKGIYIVNGKKVFVK